MITFKNPNSPQQPQKGVYAWYAKKGNKFISIYIGQAGNKSSLFPKGTLFRGISELQRNTFTSNSPSYDKLDTDFIVGTAILFFNRNGYECIWEHLNDDPQQELHFVGQQRPTLQNKLNADIKNTFKMEKSHSYWRSPDSLKVSEAENLIFAELFQYL